MSGNRRGSGGGGGGGGGRGRGRGGGKGGGGGGGDRPREDRNDPAVLLSKSLSSVLRHNAEKEGVTLRSDGFANLVCRRLPLSALPRMWPTDDLMRCDVM